MNHIKCHPRNVFSWDPCIEVKMQCHPRNVFSGDPQYRSEDAISLQTKLRPAIGSAHPVPHGLQTDASFTSIGVDTRLVLTLAKAIAGSRQLFFLT